MQKLGMLPQIAIVVPVFEHSVLVSEAIVSALRQETEVPFVVVLVNDGCLFKETESVCREFAAAYPEKVFYLHRRNAGLSAARNTGIDFALKTWPCIEAIYFLDADNRIGSRTIGKAFRALSGTSQIGWIYPTIEMFGQKSHSDCSGSYSRLMHLKNNVSEAGSLVHRRVFDAGCRFDEAMKLGFEDWEFWWQAMEAGFSGKHLPDFGFQYRQRPESMLRNSERDKAGILHYMQRKHRKLFAPKHLLNLEHEETPRYAIFLSDEERVILASDPTCRERSLGLKEFAELSQKAKRAPKQYHFPYFLVFTSGQVLKALESRGLSRWVLWRLQPGAEYFGSAVLALDFQDEEKISFKCSSEVGLPALRLRHLAMFTAPAWDKFLNTARGADDRYVLSQNLSNSRFKLQLTLPRAGTREVLPVKLGLGVRRLRDVQISQEEKSSPGAWNWRATHLPSRNRMFKYVQEFLNSGTVYPLCSRNGERHIGFVLPVLEFGGVEKVAMNIARVFKDAGWKTHLFVFNSGMSAISSEMRLFETVNFFNEPGMAPVQGPQYMGTSLNRWSGHADQRQVIGFLAWLDVVINFHSFMAHNIMGDLRRLGVRTAASLHLHDLTSRSRPAGFSHSTLGYEHAYDLMLPCSEQMAGWCHAMGVPQDKIVPVPNACGYPLDENMREKILERKWSRAQSEKLRVLFLGRFDRQKGLDRLLEIVRASRDLSMEWRIVGKSVIQDKRGARGLETIEGLIEPPILDPAELNKVYEWADVLILPSHWEGLPLTVLEAMRLGVVSCAADIGAIREIVKDGENGFLIPNFQDQRFSQVLIGHLSFFQKDRQRLKEMGKKASEAVQGRSWAKACSRFMGVVDMWKAPS